MVRYELLMLAVPEITKDETVELEKHLERSVKKAQANLISFERWGKYRLAYSVRKNQYGVYFLARFEIDSAGADLFLKEMRSLLSLKLAGIIMRDLLVKLEQSEPLTYARPESLEESPAEDVNTFLRKNKIDGLLSPHEGGIKADREELVDEMDFGSEGLEEERGEGLNMKKKFSKLKISSRLLKKKIRKKGTLGAVKHCLFCGGSDQPQHQLDYKNANLLKNFLTERGKILPSRISGICASHQRGLSNAIKKARVMALIPYMASQS